MAKKPEEEITFEMVERARRDFSRKMQRYEKIHGGGYLHQAPRLRDVHIKNCQLLPDRLRILDQMQDGGIVAEVGVDRGEFSRAIIEHTNPKELHLLELDVSRIDHNNLNFSGDKPEIKIVEGDSSSSLAAYDGEYFDWIYIDGDHNYEGIKKDAEVAKRKVKKGGYLLFNDYTVWSPATMYHCGVARAVNELCIEDGWEIEFMCIQEMFYNDVALKRL